MNGKKKKTVIIILGFISVILIIAGIFYRKWRLLSENVEVIKFYDKEEMSDFTMFAVDEKEDMVCMVIPKESYNNYFSRVASTKYILLSERSGKRFYYKYGGVPLYTFDKYNLNIYNIKKEKQAFYTVEDFNKHMPEGFLFEGFPSVVESEDGTFYLRCDINDRKKYDQEVVTKKTLTLDFEKGDWKLWERETYKMFEKQSSEKQKKYEREMNLLFNEAFMNANGFTVNSDVDKETDSGLIPIMATAKDTSPYLGEGCVKIKLNSIGLPKNNKILYGKFPELKQYQGSDEYIVWINMRNYPTPEEIMNMFVEEDKGVTFGGMPIGPKVSKDGKEHKLYTFEDYYKWVKE